MLVWKEHGVVPNFFTVAGASAMRAGVCAYEIYLSQRDCPSFECVPNKLSASMIGAFRAMCARVVGAIETCYAQWQQYVVCAIQAEARNSRAGTPKLLTLRLVRRVKAFFVCAKVNGRNAP